MVLFKSLPRFPRLFPVLLLLVVIVTYAASRLDPARKSTSGALRGFADRVAKLSARPWSRVGAGDTAEEAHRRAWELARATQYAGTGARVQRFLEKALRGEPFTVAAIGGSVSKGRGLTPPKNAPQDADGEIHGATTLYSRENLHFLVFDWLNATFPNAGNRFVNGAQGGVGAGYFAWCFKEHIPTDVDLVLVELGINDLNHLRVVAKYELLVRSVLELDSAPAIVNIETFTTLFHELISSSAMHNDVLAYYDIPSLSIRDVLLPRLMADPDVQMPRWFRTGGDVSLGDDKVREWGGVPVDLMHISAKGHGLAAGLIINYLSTQLALVAPMTAKGHFGRFSAAHLRKTLERVYDVPDTWLTQSFDPTELPERRAPVCRSMNSAKLHNRVSGADDTPDGDGDQVRGLVLHPSSHGWEPWAWHEKHYLVARTPGALAVFDFVIAQPLPATHDDDDEVIEDPMDVYSAFEGTPTDGRAASARRDMAGLKEQPASRQEMRTRRRQRRSSTFRKEHSGAGDGGTVAIGFQRSANYGLGSVHCWVDEDRAAGRRLDGWWEIKERNMGIVTEVATGLQPGRHRLQCELLADTLDPLKRHEFRLFAIVHN
ncbi:hypothetical protein VHUM_01824 [Vanrija humicola]|uniref:SGNH hydrolase-type esterase domain-containing protein n=1 Tax=Vanrija humicola TaxID=5417 RepID=A0A7D8V2K0_VANHU|nr:hypothetical protein VHUM_01824 [Vanrija humicola]